MMYFTKKTKRAPRNTTGGFTLFYSVLVSSLLLAIGLAILNITLKEFTLSSGARDSETAFYAADSALECALYWDNTQRIFGYYGDSLADDLVGYWRFEEPPEQQDDDPPIVIDSSGSGKHGRAAGAPVWTDATGGKIDQALTFDGIDDFVQLSSGIGFQGDAFTVSVWVKPTFDFPPTATVNKFFIGGPFKFGFRLNADLTADYRVAVGTPVNMPMGTLINDGAWHHLVLRRDESDTVELFVDGNTGSPINFGTLPDNTSLSVLGFQGTPGVGLYHGELDDVRIYSRALEIPEIEALSDLKILAGFVSPIDQGVATGITCAADDINDENGWWLKSSGETYGWYSWDSSPDDPARENWITEFDITFSNGTCGRVEVFKDDTASTTIVSRGYNSCDLDNPRRLERAIKAQY